MNLSVVILAAGQGKRMNSDFPKVLQPLAGQPLLQHVIGAARTVNPDNIYVVYGHGGAQVQAALAHENVEWILQAEQLGTGHAVMQAKQPRQKYISSANVRVRSIRSSVMARMRAIRPRGLLRSRWVAS